MLEIFLIPYPLMLERKPGGGESLLERKTGGALPCLGLIIVILGLAYPGMYHIQYKYLNLLEE